MTSNWILKAAAFKILSVLPGGVPLYHLLQRRVTGNALPDAGTALQKIGVGWRYLLLAREILGHLEPRAMTHFDIGSGWMPTVPFLYYSLGTDRQRLYDVRRNLQLPVVAQTARVFDRVIGSLPGPTPVRQIPAPQSRDVLVGYLRRMGIEYVAPYSPADFHGSRGWKLITCTQVLLHMDPESIASLFRALASVMCKGDLLMATVKCYDVWSDRDLKLSPYNKWRYSEFVWEHLVNSRLMSFNRLTPSRYRTLLQTAGFDIVRFDVTGPTDADTRELRRIPVHHSVRHLSEADLGAREVLFVATVPC